MPWARDRRLPGFADLERQTGRKNHPSALH
jgi:hypothetical protein